MMTSFMISATYAVEIVNPVSSTTTVATGVIRLPVHQSAWIEGHEMSFDLNNAVRHLDKSEVHGYIAGNGNNGTVNVKDGWRKTTLNEMGFPTCALGEEEAKLEILNFELLAEALEKALGRTTSEDEDLLTLINDSLIEAVQIDEGEEYLISCRVIPFKDVEKFSAVEVAKIFLPRWNDFISVYCVDWNGRGFRLALATGSSGGGSRGTSTTTKVPSSTPSPVTPPPASTPTPAPTTDFTIGSTQPADGGTDFTISADPTANPGGDTGFTIGEPTATPASGWGI